MTIVDCDDYIEELFGYKKHELIGRSHSIIMPTDEVFSPKIIIDKLLFGTPVVSSNYNLHKNGKLVMCRWKNSPVIIKGAVVRIISTVSAIKQSIEQPVEFGPHPKEVIAERAVVSV